MHIDPTCLNCGGSNLYKSSDVSSGGGYAPNYLPDLGSHFGFVSAQFTMVVCTDCGLTNFFASDKAVAKIPGSKKWQRVQPGV